jgi:hypothetical protein
MSKELIERLRAGSGGMKHWQLLETEAADRIEALEADLETERLRLAACGIAALGYFDSCNCKDEYRSASLDDTLRLYDENKKLRAELAALKAELAEEHECRKEADRAVNQYHTLCQQFKAEIAALKATAEAQEPVGDVTIDFFRGTPGMANHSFDYYGKLPAGTHSLYATPAQSDKASKPNAALLPLAEQCGAVITGKPDGSESISVMFSIKAWRAFDAAMGETK